MLIYTHAGPEIAVASTKAYIVQISVMYLFAFELALAKGTIDEDMCKQLTAELERTPDVISEILETIIEQTQYVSTKLVSADSLLYIGRGLDYLVSQEGSLKLKEIAYLHSEAYAAGELKHGPIAMIDENTLVVAVAVQEDVMEKTISNIKEVKARGAKTMAIAMQGNTKIAEVADDIIYIPRTIGILAPVLANIPNQLFAYFMALNLGTDIDKPRNLAKSVTVE